MRPKINAVNTGNRRHTVCAAAILAVTMLQAGCVTSVTGRPVRAPGPPAISTLTTTASAPVPISAHDLLLHDGDRTPLGTATMAPVGDNYFTSVRPPQCSAAMLFKDSPLRPPVSSDYADSAYRFGLANYAESVNVYDKDKALDPAKVVQNGFSAVTSCNVEAVGVSPLGQSPPLRLSFFAIPRADVLVWTMTSPHWTCDYGLAVIPRVALLLSACNTKRGFPMAAWASIRRLQIQARVA